MKKFNCLVLILAVFCGIQGIYPVQAQETIKLKWASPYPIGHLSHHHAVQFIDLIHKYTNQRVKIDYFPQEQLGKAKEMLYLCSQGTADLAQVHITYFAGQLPLNNVAMLPFFTTATEGTEIYARLVEASAEIRQEFQKFGVRVINVNTTPQYDIGTVKKPVQKPEDARGLKLKTAGGMYNIIAQQYKILPINIAAVETYESIKRGTVEGVIFSYPSIKAYRLNEVLKYYTLGLKMGGYPASVVVNEKRWQQLSKDIREAISKAAVEMNKIMGKGWDDHQEELSRQFAKEGMVIYRIPPEGRAAWETPLKGIEEFWIKDVEKKGLPGKKVFNDFLKIAQAVAK